MKINDYVNKKVRKKSIVTTVSIRQDQKDFLEKNNVNISQLVRDLLDSIIEKETKKK